MNTFTTSPTKRSPRSPHKLSPAEAAKELLLRREARRKLLAFTTFTKPDYEVSWHHRLLADLIDDLVEGRKTRALVCFPPRHGKSELTSRRAPAYALGKNPDLNIISASYSADLASMMNRDVQRIIESREYRALFPGTRLNDSNVRAVAGGTLRNSDIFEVVGRSGRYRSAGVGGGITGMGFDLGIIDDPFKNREEADSPVVRERVWEWYTSTFRTRAAKGARILVTLTRWHRDDLAGRLLKLAESDPTADQWEVLVLPAIAENPQHPDPRRPGEALWPDRFPLEELEKLKRNSLYEWAALYQQNPNAEGGAEWDDSYFPSGMWFDEWPDDLLVKVLALDPSKGKDARHGDFSAFVRLGVDSQRVLWVEADLARRPTPRIVQDGVSHLLEWRPHGTAVEANQFQSLLADEFDRVARAAGVLNPSITQYDNRVPKVVRVRTLGPLLAARRVRFRATPGTRLLVDQLRDFPNGEHDDGPDALEMAVRLAGQLVFEPHHHDRLAGQSTLTTW